MKLFKDFGVRALYGVIVISVTAGTLCYLAIQGNNEARVALEALAGVVIGFYFGQRGKQEESK